MFFFAVEPTVPELADGRAVRGQVQQLHHRPRLLLDGVLIQPGDTAEVPQGLLDVELVVQPQLLQQRPLSDPSVEGGRVRPGQVSRSRSSPVHNKNVVCSPRQRACRLITSAAAQAG